MRSALLLLYLTIALLGHAQTDSDAYKDQILSYNDFIEIVLSEHPIARQANLQNSFADVEQLKARGVIDPKISMSFDRKEFNGTDYFDILKSEVKIPTVLGLNVKANYESANGEFINPESFTANNGIWSAGVEMDVLRDFAYNERKAAFDQAAVFRNQTKNVQELLLNQLLIEASNAYVEWFTATENVKIIEENLSLAETYLLNIRDAVNLGDKPAIDTLEANTILLGQLINYQEEELKRVKAKFSVNNYLWQENTLLFLGSNTNPNNPTINTINATVTIDQFFNHPEVLDKQLKIDQIQIKNKLAKQQLLPKLELGYYPLVPTEVDSFLPTDTDVSNYKIGASFAVPLFRRKEKAQLQQTVLEQNQLQLDLQNKANELFIKWNIENNNIQNLEQQIDLLQEAQSNFESLAEAELIRYNYGESSVFLVNQRLVKVIDNRLKVQKLKQLQLEARLKQLYLENNLIP